MKVEAIFCNFPGSQALGHHGVWEAEPGSSREGRDGERLAKEAAAFLRFGVQKEQAGDVRHYSPSPLSILHTLSVPGEAEGTGCLLGAL